MTEFNVQEFPNGNVADDGMSVSINMRLENGEIHTLIMPFKQLDWLNNALLTLSNGAYTRQIETGRLEAANPIDPAMLVEGFRVLPNSKKLHALVHMTGRQDANGPIGMGSFVLAQEHIRSLGERLLEVAGQLNQMSKPQ